MSKKTRCKSCGASIAYKKAGGAPAHPFNLDGTSHFTTCPQARTWRKRKKTKPKIDEQLELF